MTSPAPGTGYICAEGGGDPLAGEWGAAVFSWMVQRAEDSLGSSNALVLGLSRGSDAPLTAFLANGADSSVSLDAPPSAANDPAIASAVADADIVWIRGGDQAAYLHAWAGTAVEDAIESVYDSGGVIGGTSAGAAILGEMVYDATNGSLSPTDALTDARHPRLSFTKDFITTGAAVLFDTHFTERGRLPRLALMLAHAGDPTLIGVGLDDRTALCISPDLTATVLGSGAVTLLRRTDSTRVRLESSEPPFITGIEHTQLTERFRVDLSPAAPTLVIERPADAVSAGAPAPRDELNAVTIEGDAGADVAAGAWVVEDAGNDFALFDGALALSPGSGLLPASIVSTRPWESADSDENRVGGPQWAIHERPHSYALFVPRGARIEAMPPSTLEVTPGNAAPAAAMVLDAFGMTHSAQSDSLTSDTFSVGPRQSVTIESAELHLLPPGQTYDTLRRVAPPRCQGDTDADDAIDLADLLTVLANFANAVTGGPADGDLNSSGAVDLDDLLRVLSNFGTDCSHN